MLWSIWDVWVIFLVQGFQIAISFFLYLNTLWAQKTQQKGNLISIAQSIISSNPFYSKNMFHLSKDQPTVLISIHFVYFSKFFPYLGAFWNLDIFS